MKDLIKLTDKQIRDTYKFIKEYHDRFLKRYGVKLPKLYLGNKFTKDALTLIYLAIGYPRTRIISKTELTNFVRKYYPDVNDVQQARHLGAQKGWWITAGGRDNIVIKLKLGQYQLYSLEKPYPAFKGHRITKTDNWLKIKKQYRFRCVTCGSQEGEPNFHWPATKTKLQMAHMDPRRPLIAGNIIPQCQKCNRADRNRWVYDERGRVIKLAKANFVKNFDKEIRWKIYKILYEEFEGKPPKK